jgi:hypothetical protein
MLSLKQLETYNLNELPDVYLSQGTAQNTAVRNPFLGAFPATSALGQATTVSQRQLWLQFPQFTSVNMNGANTGTTTYNALQAKVEKRLSHGLTVLGTYSFSKLIHNNMTSLVNERHYRSIASLDQPHLFRLAVTYQLPGPLCPARGGTAVGSRSRRMGRHRIPLDRVRPAAQHQPGERTPDRDRRSAHRWPSQSASGRRQRRGRQRPESLLQHQGVPGAADAVHGIAAGPVHQPIARSGADVAERIRIQVLPHCTSACAPNCAWRRSTQPIIRTSTRPARTCRARQPSA